MLGPGTGRGRTTLWPLGGQRANAWPWPASWARLTQSIPTISAGFAVATLRSASIAHPVLAAPATVTISGWVEVREERERSDRIVVRAHRVDGKRLTQTPERV